MGRVLPILFNTDMVRAILDGRKTVTRRLIKKSQCMMLSKKEPSELQKDDLYAPFDGMTDAEVIKSGYKPPYNPGSILYVRETWAFIGCIGCSGEYARPGSGMACYDVQAVEYDDGDSISDGCFVYRADCKNPDRICWHPSIHMPKEAARIWLRVTDVRVERLQEITKEQAKAEGAKRCYEVINPRGRKTVRCAADNECGYYTVGFWAVWDSTVKKAEIDKYGWDANPWVWVIEFERCEKPG